MKEEHKEFLMKFRELRNEGKTEREISHTFGFRKVSEFRRKKSHFLNEEYDENLNEAKRLKEMGLEVSEIAKAMNLPKSSIVLRML